MFVTARPGISGTTRASSGLTHKSKNQLKKLTEMIQLLLMLKHIVDGIFNLVQYLRVRTQRALQGAPLG